MSREQNKLTEERMPKKGCLYANLYDCPYVEEVCKIQTYRKRIINTRDLLFGRMTSDELRIFSTKLAKTKNKKMWWHKSKGTIFCTTSTPEGERLLDEYLEARRH